jgi:hypothetical protein
MGYQPYVELVRKQFTFLIDKYGFSGPYQLSDDNVPHGYGNYVLIEYRSDTSTLTILRERLDELSVTLQPIGNYDRLSIRWIVEFFTAGAKTIHVEPYVPKETIRSSEEEFIQFVKASTAGKDVSRFMKELSPAEKARREAWQEYRLNVYATALRQFGDPFLRGDFSKWGELTEYVRRRIAEDYRTAINRNQTKGWRQLIQFIKRKIVDK